MARLVRLQSLVGRRVHDAEGKVVGRIEEVRAEMQGDDLVVTEYLCGPAAILTRLGIRAMRLIGLRQWEPTRIAWDQLDLSDPHKPRVI